MKQYKITIRKGAEIVHQATGETHTLEQQLTTTAERDPNSGCMLFFYGDIFYVSEGYRVLPQGGK